jgi:hypothetical protein
MDFLIGFALGLSSYEIAFFVLYTIVFGGTIFYQISARKPLPSGRG